MASKRAELLVQRLIKTTKEHARKHELKTEYVPQVEREFSTALTGLMNYLDKIERDSGRANR